jgi:hypothetical protein
MGVSEKEKGEKRSKKHEGKACVMFQGGKRTARDLE